MRELLATINLFDAKQNIFLIDEDGTERIKKVALDDLPQALCEEAKKREITKISLYSNPYSVSSVVKEDIQEINKNLEIEELK